MDIKGFISKISQRKPIWDKREKSHSNRIIIEKCWAEIEKEMGVDANLLRRKWKYLRDQFAVELGKITISRSGDGAAKENSSKWPHFQSLLFLRDVVKPRTASGNLCKSTNSNSIAPCLSSLVEIGDSDGEVSINTPEAREVFSSHEGGITKEEMNEQPKECLPLNRGRKKTCPKDENLLNIEKQMLQYLQEKSSKKHEDEAGDDDLYFFKSLLPYVRKIPQSTKLLFRNRVQDLVQEFSYQQDFNSSVPIGQSFHPSTPSPGPTDSSQFINLEYNSENIQSLNHPSTFNIQPQPYKYNPENTGSRNFESL